jgi:tetratricopeptide (TPR) repeat protein
MKNFVLLFLGLVLVQYSSIGQYSDAQIRDFVETASESDLVQRNTLLLTDEYYFQSIIVADKLLEIDSERPNYNYRKGYAIIRLSADYKKAKPFFENASKSTSKNFDAFSTKETSAPVDSYYYLGRCYHYEEDIEKARQYYREFVEQANNNSELIPIAELTLKQCDQAEEFMKYPRNYEIINLGQQINSTNPEYAPVVSLDGKSLYFTSRRLREDKSNEDIKDPETNMFNEDVYVSKKENNGKWGEAKVLDFCLPERNDASIAVSTDERTIYLYRDDQGNGDIFYSDFVDGRFRDITSIDANGVNTDAWEPHITVSADGSAKYFVSDREGGFGGRDIYRIVKLPNGEWSEPQNLGPRINTPHDEDAPFLAVDNKTLYFASNGEKSMGGFDVFITVLDDEGVWSDAINLGYPFNSMGDDIYYTTTADGYQGYLSSFRSGGSGEKDIYQITNDYLGVDNVALLAGKINVAEGEKIPEDVAITINCLNCGDRFERTVYPRLSDGVFLSNLLPCRTYEVVFHYGDIDNRTEFYKEIIETDCEDDYQQIDMDVFLDVPTMSIIDKDQPTEEEIFAYAPLRFEHFYGYNNKRLNDNHSELKSFISLIENQIKDGRAKVEIFIESSASKVPTRTFGSNMNLANKRSQGIQEMLTSIIKNNELLAGKVTVSENKVSVNGPSYAGDPGNIAKYAPYQYIKLNVKSVGESEIEEKSIRSKDDELEGKLK